MKGIKIDRILDIKGLQGPRPTVMTLNTLKDMESGMVLKVITDDASTRHTIPHFCMKAGYRLIEFIEEDGLIYFIIQK